MALFGNMSVGSMSGWPGPQSISEGYYETNPDAAYARLLAQQGLLWNPSAYAQWAGRQASDVHTNYLAQLGGMEHPENYSYVQFLQDFGPKLSDLYQQQSPQQRGEQFPGGVGKMRYVGF